MPYLLRPTVLLFLCTAPCACLDFSSNPLIPQDSDDEGVDSEEGLDDDDGTQDDVDVTDLEWDDAPGQCGNGRVETGEECDDGNDVEGDGCDNDCTFSCREDWECADPDICNGRETCSPDTHTCGPGPPRQNGFLCAADPRSICLEVACVESTCGDGFVDTGGGEFCDPPAADGCLEDCGKPCATDTDCPDDGNPCNGTEYCAVFTETCARRDPLSDGSECDGEAGLICVSSTCQESICGDGYEDSAAGEECDDGNFTDGDGCNRNCLYSCHDTAECDDGLACTEDLCDTEGTHTCINTVRDAGTECRPAAGECDVAEECDGSAPDCPVDAFAPSDRLCRDAAGSCDESEHCTGSTVACPADDFQPAGTSCDDGSECTEGDACDGAGACVGSRIDNLYDVDTVASGFYHTCAVLHSGAMKCWGRNGDGQLGDGTRTDRRAPVYVAGLASAAQRAASGGYHTCALLDDDAVLCWGRNGDGQLGDGTTTDSLSPTEVQLSTSPAPISVACGLQHTCALNEDGNVRCWGYNNKGQLGDGTTTGRALPVLVTGLASPALGISAGRYHTCAVLTGGGVSCWGMNENGELGNGTGLNSSTPVVVSGLTSGVLSVAAGAYHTCALLQGSGSVMCWGSNTEGQLGDGTLVRRLTPVDVSGITAVASLSAGGYHTCAALDGGQAMCWGKGDEGQLGSGSVVGSPTPVDVTGLSAGLASLTLGFYHSCGYPGAGGVMCWGGGGYGQLGNGTNANSPIPVDVHCH